MMAIKILILKSGERLICDLEKIEEENQYLMNYPRKVEVLNINTKTNMMNLAYEPWCDLTVDEHIVISSDWVVSTLIPNPDISLNYEQNILNKDATDLNI